MVLSGVPFYEEGDDALFGDDDESQDEEPAQAALKSKSSENKFEDGGHKPLKNVLAGVVADKIAVEKREKMQLI